jgi:hypothetical protein
LVQREADQGTRCRVTGPSARRVAWTDGGPFGRIEPGKKQVLLRRVVHFQREKCSPNGRDPEVGGLPKTVRPDKLKYMSRFIFAALGSLSLACAAAAQQVPGRDLLEFPVGVLAEAPVLSSQMTGGLWNPATAALRNPRRAAFGFASLSSPQDLGVRVNLLGGAYNVRPNVTAIASITSGSVSDILRTETNPQSIGPEIDYGTTMFSAGLATAQKSFSFGVNARYRKGTSDDERKSAFYTDAGFVVNDIVGVPIRVAASTFLFGPWSSSHEATYAAAADAPVVRRDSTIAVRVGGEVAHTEGRGRENYVFASGFYRVIDLSAGVAHSYLFGNTSNRWRLGLGLRYASYTVAVGREDAAAGFGANYQFLLKRVIR